MPTRRRYRSSGALISQLVEQDSTLGSGSILTEAFDDFLHRSSKMVLKKLDVSLGCVGIQNNLNLQRARFAIISKPISEGNPVAGDFDNEKYNKWQRQCYAFFNTDNNMSSPDYIHVEDILKIVIDIGWNVFFSVLNEGLNSVAVAFALRLFVKYI